MVWAKATRYPPPAVSIPQMISKYSGGMKKRILRYILAAFVVGFIIFCEIRKQSWSSKYQSSSLRQQHLHGEPLSSGHGLVKQLLREENDGALQIDFSAATRPVVGKITISFGEPDPVYDRAIRSHEYHNKRMGYPQFVLKERVLSGLWSKHAYIFSALVQELAKPEDQRLLWLMWLDRDTVLMNPNLPLEMFIPPPGLEDIHLLTTNDRNGLNNGVFFFKVNQWSLKFFSAALAFGHYNPDVKLKYTEQSAMEEVLRRTAYFNKSMARVPQRWFNAFPPSEDKKRNGKQHGRPGQLLLHFASNRDGQRPERMTKWMDIADQEVSEWRVPLNETSYPHQIGEYWRRFKNGDNVNSIIDALEGEM